MTCIINPNLRKRNIKNRKGVHCTQQTLALFVLGFLAMSLATWFVILSLYHLLFLINSAETKCSESFSCGTHGRLEFPFTNSDKPDCGLFTIDGCNNTSEKQRIRLGADGEWYTVLQNISSNRLHIRAEIIKNHIESNSCFAFLNLSLPKSPSVSFMFSPNLTLLTCLLAYDSEPPEEWSSYEGQRCPGFTVYYSNLSQDDSWERSKVSNNCSLIQLPSSNPYKLERPEGVFGMLTSEFTLEWNISEECYKCHHGGGQCLTNNMSSFRCRGNGRLKLIPTIAAISGGGIVLILIFVVIIYSLFKARQRCKFFNSNGGLLLEQKLSLINNGCQKSKLFSSRELAQATDYYNENRILGRGGQATVYKGMLTDGSIVAVKKYMKLHQTDIEVFINEVVILSQINHRNIVRVLGCCLETKVPLLVYEFIPNGTLFEHIHDPSEDFLLTWEMRLRIATEVAGAVAYLHSSASAPIFHRDIKSTNILLDESYRAKISDFGTSRLLAVDQTHFTTRVLGTFGYLDPEYFRSNQFTEKSDVYSFGVVMVELLTGEKAISLIRAEDERSLATYFLRSMEEEDKLFDIVDARIDLREGKRGEVVAVAELSRRCLHSNGKLRPTMRQVANELESIQVRNSSSSVEQNQDCLGVSDSVEPAASYDYSSLLTLTLER